MNGEQGRNERASPQAPSHLPQHQEQHDNSDSVQKNIGEMVPGRVKTIHLAIQHVRNDGKRVPVTSYGMRKSPDDTWQRKTSDDIWIPENVLGIVVCNELISQCLTEN